MRTTKIKRLLIALGAAALCAAPALATDLTSLEIKARMSPGALHFSLSDACKRKLLMTPEADGYLIWKLTQLYDLRATLQLMQTELTDNQEYDTDYTTSRYVVLFVGMNDIDLSKETARKIVDTTLADTNEEIRLLTIQLKESLIEEDCTSPN